MVAHRYLWDAGFFTGGADSQIEGGAAQIQLRRDARHARSEPERRVLRTLDAALRRRERHAAVIPLRVADLRPEAVGRAFAHVVELGRGQLVAPGAVAGHRQTTSGNSELRLESGPALERVPGLQG